MSLICTRCNMEFNLRSIKKGNILKNPNKYKMCADCRKYRPCGNCGEEFNHVQNQTCSKECAQELKEKSFMNSCGTKHNFYRKSTSRKKWENNLLINEGITNVFQRESVKKKSMATNISKYGVDNVSKSIIIQNKKRDTLAKTMENNPNLFKENWNKLNKYFIQTIGYDPRLHLFGKASKASLIIFEPLLRWCLENNILLDDVYLGVGDNKEYFIYTDNGVFFYDFTIRSKKIIIEYNGIAFHAKSECDNWFNPFTNESASENIKKYKIKKEAAYEKGFVLLEIWSDEDPLINLELCKKFIKNNI